MKTKKTTASKVIIRTLLLLALACIVAAIIIYTKKSKAVHYNENTAANGNTAGNLYNNGLYAEYDGKVYFSNPLDKGCLYVMDKNGKHAKKLNSDTVFSINAYGSYLYYARNNLNDSNSTSVLRGSLLGANRCNLDGRSSIELHDKYTGNVVLIGNTLFMQCYESDRAKNETTSTVRSIDIAGGESEEFYNKPINIAGTTGTRIYFSGVENDHNIYALNTQNKTTSLIATGNFWMPIVRGKELYYLDLDNGYSLVKSSITDPDETTVLVDERISTYNVSDTFIYFQIDDKENSKLCRIRKDAQTNEYEVIAKGNFEDINVTSTYVYFHTFNREEETYRTPVTGAIHVEALSDVLKFDKKID